MPHGRLKSLVLTLLFALPAATATAAPLPTGGAASHPEAGALRAENGRLARAAAAAVEASGGPLSSLEERWLIARAALVLLALALAAALAVAGAALRQYRRAERYARALARELDGKRQAALAERQESARRILDLEARLSTLERGPRVVIGGRSG
jgi:hypothetical protein